VSERAEGIFDLKTSEVTGRWSAVYCTLREILLFRTALGATQLPVLWVTGTPMLGAKRTVFEPNH
jgi:hypothetical protein